MSWLESHTCDSKYHPRDLRPEGLLGCIIRPFWRAVGRHLIGEQIPPVSRDPLCLEELDFQNIVLTSEEGLTNLVG